MGRDYTEEEKAFLSQVTASGSGLQRTTTTLSVKDEQVDNSGCDYLIFDPTGTIYIIFLITTVFWYYTHKSIRYVS